MDSSCIIPRSIHLYLIRKPTPQGEWEHITHQLFEARRKALIPLLLQQIIIYRLLTIIPYQHMLPILLHATTKHLESKCISITNNLLCFNTSLLILPHHANKQYRNDGQCVDLLEVISYNHHSTVSKFHGTFRGHIA